jgi:hypothetical protein
MNTTVSNFCLEDGTEVLIETERQDSFSVEPLSGGDSRQEKKTIEAALRMVKPAISVVVSELRSSVKEPASEVEISFGLKFTGSGSIVIGSLGSEINFQVKLKWIKSH